MAGGLITYEENGFPVELVTDRDIARAVGQGKLRPETIVHHYRDDGSVSAGRADQFDRLQSYFDPAEVAEAGAAPPAPLPQAGPSAPRAPPEAPAETEPDEPEDEAEAAAGIPARNALLGDEPSEEEVDDRGSETDRSASGGGAGILAIIVSLVLIALFLFAALGGRRDTSASGDSLPGNEIAAGAPTDIIGVETSYWVNRGVRVRGAPGLSSPARGSLKRGELIRGIQVRGPSGQGDWIRVEAGSLAGGYAWIKNFSTAERPVLVSTSKRTRKLARGQTVYAEADLTSQSLNSVPAGAPVRLTGLTAGGWWELELDGGGVGYLEPETQFAGCSGLDCRILTPDGWGEFRAGASVGTAEAASGFALVRPGHYDEYVNDEPDRARACNIHMVTGAPANLTVFVQEGIVTSVGATLEKGAPGVRFETDRGIALGDAEEAVRLAYPELDQEPDIYSAPPDKKLFYRRSDGKGIKFSIVGGRITEIAAGGNSINYVEGCL